MIQIIIEVMICNPNSRMAGTSPLYIKSMLINKLTKPMSVMTSMKNSTRNNNEPVMIPSIVPDMNILIISFTPHSSVQYIHYSNSIRNKNKYPPFF